MDFVTWLRSTESVTNEEKLHILSKFAMDNPDTVLVPRQVETDPANITSPVYTRDVEETTGPLGESSGQSSTDTPVTTVPFNYIRTLSYNNHWFTSFTYGTTTETTKQLFTDLQFKTQPESLILQPTTAAQIDFDGSDIVPATPIVLANSYVSWPLHVSFIHVLGNTTAGTLNCFGFW